MNTITTLAQTQTMSSREIAALVEKRHDNVIRDIRAMLTTLYGEDSSNLSHDINQSVTIEKDNRGYISSINLDYDHTMTLITGYKVELRHAVIKRWKELEAAQAQQASSPEVPQTFSEALRLAADLVEKNERLEQERNQAIRAKGQISSSREASTMAKLRHSLRRIDTLETDLGYRRDYKTVKAIPWLKDYFVLTRFAYAQIGKTLKAIGDQIGKPAHDIADEEFGKIKAHHCDAIEHFHTCVTNNPTLLAAYRKTA